MLYNLQHIIESVAISLPDRVAFSCLKKVITYQELDHQANQLAHFLLNNGHSKGDRIGIFMPRCLESVIAVYGILKSGAAYVPLDPFAPTHRTAAIMEDCNIKTLVTIPNLKNRTEGVLKETSQVQLIIGPETISNGTSIAWETIHEENYSKPLLEILESDLAFILYTSGSTGAPKGIMHTHYSALSLAKIVADTFDFHEDDIFGNPAPLHFDPSTFGYFVAPLVRAKTVIIPEAYLKMPASLSVLIAQEKISVWYSVPLMLIQLLKSNTLTKHDFSHLRWIFFAGEVFTPKHLKALMETLPQARYCNLYGPAELILCTYYPLEEIPEAHINIPIGKTWANTEFKILNSQGEEVAHGEEGELAIRSATLMQGYWNNPEMTKKCFYQVNIAQGYQHTYYKTGDLVKLNESNELLFLGRNDRQIKLRGYRVELDEVENILSQHPLVEEAAVIALKDTEETQKLQASILLKHGKSLQVDALQEFCSQFLPSYALPESITIMKDFPRTSSGKIDRRQIANLIDQPQT
ncbi:amino acid adenylation domain-containing protein [Euzebyella saccharophila]|uniref:Amino acid adenylation domain-containing protein n=1 Tax=Euzebyella saccharophila TaxID=679664 RepID=A0ABV8JY70_9FLAO